MWYKKHRLRLSATQCIAVVFLLLILAGAAVLSLPAASASGVSCGFFPALFTATSATCVTGLVMFDTWQQWSVLGQNVILCLIEIGGLGFMSAASLVVFLLRRKVGLRQRMVMAQALSVSDMDGVVRLQKWVLIGSMMIQLTGALVLFLRFVPRFGWEKALRWGIFHSVSAFCNAGFDIFGELQVGAGVSLFQNDPVVLLTLAMLIIVGGLGFFVWEEVVCLRKWKKFSVYTKLVLLTSGVLLVGGTVAFSVLEWNNAGTLGTMTVGEKLLNAFFQSVTVRTAGFAGLDQALLTDGGKAVSIVLMLVGGSSGSTAGGVKTVTLVVMLLFLWTRARGKNTVCVFKRTIPATQVLDAMSITGIVVSLAVFGGVFLCTTSPVAFTDALYESVSALATVGLTAGVTSQPSFPGLLLIMVYMYFGRVGVLTISLGFLMGDKAEERFQYARTNLLIG
jgi:trk system potassium uptake protein TrkH